METDACVVIMAADETDSDPMVRRFEVYGYCVLYKIDANGKWVIDQDDEYRNLPAHYLSMEEALDRVEWLRAKHVPARVAALMAESTDDGATFEENRNA